MVGVGDDEACNTKLQLGLGGCEYDAPRQEMMEKDNNPLLCLDLTFALCPKPEDDHTGNGSSLRTTRDEDDEENERSFDTNNKNGVRKKLRLTKEQSTLLEDSFNRHTTLNPAQKQSLADQLKLKPRQVEVWFQNRRARTKLKQTEVDCEFLKKCCESLSDENRRLKKELQELKSLNTNGQLYAPIPKTTMLTMCQSCEKMVRSSSAHHHHHQNNQQAASAKMNTDDDLMNVVRKSD